MLVNGEDDRLKIGVLDFDGDYTEANYGNLYVMNAAGDYEIALEDFAANNSHAQMDLWKGWHGESVGFSALDHGDTTHASNLKTGGW